MWTYNYENSNKLYHHGIKKQKWGVRRYQNKDGTLTPAGRRRAKKLASQYGKLTGQRMRTDSVKKSTEQNNQKPKESSIKEMSDDELRRKIQRLQLEQQYNSLQPKHVSAGKNFVNKVLAPSITDASKVLLKDWLIKEGQKVLGLPTNNQNSNKKKKN